MANAMTTAPKLKPCPICEGRADVALRRKWYHVECQYCGLQTNGCRLPEDAIVEWNHRPVEDRLRAALIRASASLAGMASAYRKYAKRHVTMGRSETDPFYSTRIDDFDRAAREAHEDLVSPTAKTDPISDKSSPS